MGSPLPGLALAVLDQEHMTVTDVLLSEDGHAQERAASAVYPLVRRGRGVGGGPQLLHFGIARGYLGSAAASSSCQHGNVQGELLGQRRSKGRCETGWVYEQRLRLRGEERQVIEVRRITVVLDKPTRDGDTEIHILTNLPPRKVPAVRVAEIYRKRWTIEGLFFEVAQTLS